uniref:Uncharacterized protein n=1 Tax=Setaria viridis TaxID=4556 RepID=A0A4U6UVB0_SETVI|nr:transcription termination factor MTERF9, chloroplastic-like isoform X2 [Setaria viridis]XP_034590637.1 transcription termination factor MTERF9, chloroplastic-like isoform X2 [Setaria viridis]TKW20530.1 hypothetical protein SEVIR_4G094600v2 [Setaria viridis]
MLRLQNHLLRFLRVASPLPSPIHPRARLLLSTSTAPAPFSLEDYLVAACSLTPAQARKASKQAFCKASKLAGKPFEEFSCSRLNSASNPDAVLALLSGFGLSRADIAAIVAADPLILRCRVEKIGPRILALRDHAGLSTPQVARFLLVGSRGLRSVNVATHVEFLISFYGSFERLLVVVKRNINLLSSSLERVIEPNIALLHQCGLSVRDIAQLCSNVPRLLSFNQERVKEFLLRAEELGVPRTSRMFKYAVAVVVSNSREKVAARLDFLKRTLDCSKVSIAVSRLPLILGFSPEILLRKIEFLINEVRLEPRYIVERPYLFALSLEKRMIPRHTVMKVLQEKGLLSSNKDFYSLCKIPEKTFKLKFINCHKDSVPGLAEIYAAASVQVMEITAKKELPMTHLR